jgi:hypothetical protein
MVRVFAEWVAQVSLFNLGFSSQGAHPIEVKLRKSPT